MRNIDIPFMILNNLTSFFDNHLQLNMEQQSSKTFTPDPSIFTCLLCQDILSKPVTLGCGHSFCHYCILNRFNPQEGRQNENDRDWLVPVCPQCKHIIWRPLTELKQNVAISNLTTRYNLKSKLSHPPLLNTSSLHHKHHILVNCQETASIPMPHCTTQIVFTTSFMDQIMQQQSQTQPIVLTWPDAPDKMAITGRISRPEIFHPGLRMNSHESVFRAQFDGLSYATIVRKQDIMINLEHSYEGVMQTQSALSLCQWEEITAINRQTIAQFRLFFNIYDQLNNPIYIRQISHLVNQRVLHERNDPQALIYCMLRVLRMPDKQVKELVASMDDQVRWEAIQDFLLRSNMKTPEQIIRVTIPGNYSSQSIFLAILLFLLFYFFTQ